MRTLIQKALWWAYERGWLRAKRGWTNDSFIGVRVAAANLTFVVCGRAGHAEVVVRKVGSFRRGATGIVNYSMAPYTHTKLAGFGGLSQGQR